MKTLKRLTFWIVISNVTVIVILLYKVMRNHDMISIFYGMNIANDKKNELIDISYSGEKFIAIKNKSNFEKFEDLLEARGFKHIANYGRSDVYLQDGVEHLVKRSVVFCKYYLFEIF